MHEILLGFFLKKLKFMLGEKSELVILYPGFILLPTIENMIFTKLLVKGTYLYLKILIVLK